MPNSIRNAIDVVNSHCPNILAIQKWMLLARIQRAAKLGDVDAQRYMILARIPNTPLSGH